MAYRPPPVRGRKVENDAPKPIAKPAVKPAAKAAPAVSAVDIDRARLDLDRTRLALKRQLKILQARDHFIDFVQFTMPDPDDPSDPDRSSYDTQKHHRAIARTLEEVENGNIKRLILTLPPRAGKSELASRRFPPWLIGKDPRRHVIFATYNDTFALDFGAEVREILYSPQYKQVFPGTTLRKGGAAKDRLQTGAGGLLVYVGRGGSITGRGADFLIIDDLFKDAEEARSPAIREQVWSWFTKVAMTRLMSSSARVVLITTRWHEDDLIGRLTDARGGANPHFNPKEAAKWKIINLPMIAEHDDPLGRQKGELLWPERFDRDFVEERQRLDPLGFSALYQQRPTVEDGVMFRREHIESKFYTDDDLPSDLRIYSASDHAVGLDPQRHDASVLLTVGVDRHQGIWLLDCYWERAPTDQVVEAMLAIARTRKPLVWWAEKGHISKSIGPFLRKRMLETNTFFNVQEMTPATNKEQRAQSIAARVALGYVRWPRNAPWVERAIAELLKFPNGTHDDFVDAFAYIGLGLGQQFGPATAVVRELPRYRTLAWVKQQSNMNARVEKMRKLATGF